MNLAGVDFERLSREKRVPPLHLAREFVQLEILRRLSASELRRLICFKGGTALHLVFGMERYSEDLDFSVASGAAPSHLRSAIEKILEGEEVTDSAVKRKTVLVEIRQEFHPHSFRVKLEINTDNVVPAELKTLYSEYVPASFHVQVMRIDHLVAQKLRALLQRGKGRDLYDLWFILRTRLPIDLAVASQLMGVPAQDVYATLEKTVEGFDGKRLSSDLNPFVTSSLRKWIRESLKKDVVQLLRSHQLAVG